MKSILVLALFGVAGCNNADKDEDTEYTVSDQDLTGVVGGESWSFVAGHTNDFLSDEEDFFTDLYAEEFEPCGFDVPAGNSVIISVPTEPGEYPMGLSQNMTFVVNGNENLVATEGIIVVDEVGEDTLSAGIYAMYDEDNEIDGHFTATICVDEES